jgi:hypothetical protein
MKLDETTSSFQFQVRGRVAHFEITHILAKNGFRSTT